MGSDSGLSQLQVQRVGLSGIVPAFEYVAAEGNEFANDGRTSVEIENGSLFDSYTVTFVAQGFVQGVAFDDVRITIGVGARKKIGPFPKVAFNNANGRVEMMYGGNSPESALVIAVFGV